jgi:hypothetical protein
MILKNIEEEAILFLFYPHSRDVNVDTYSSLIMKFNYRDIYNSINFKVETRIAYIVNDNLSNKKIILGVQEDAVLFSYDLYEQLKRLGITSVVMPVLSKDYFENTEEEISNTKSFMKNVKKVLTVLANDDKLSLEVKILEVEKENEE